MSEFIINLPEDIDATVAGAEKLITEAGGEFSFVGDRGWFSIKGVEGAFHILDTGIEVNITKKPFYVSHSYIRKSVMEYFA